MRILEDNELFTFYGEDHIIYYIYKKPVLDLETAKKAVATRIRLTDNKPCMIITDLTMVKTTPKEARDYYKSNNNDAMVQAVALVTPSVISRLLGSFFINFNKPRIPVKMFNSKEKALEWVRGIVMNAV